MSRVVFKSENETVKRVVKSSEQRIEILNYIRDNINKNNLSKATRFEELANGSVSTKPVYAAPTKVYYVFKTKGKESIKICLDPEEYGEINLEGELNYLVERTIKVKNRTNLKRFAVGVAIAGCLFGTAYGVLQTVEYEDKQFAEQNKAWAEESASYRESEINQDALDAAIEEYEESMEEEPEIMNRYR